MRPGVDVISRDLPVPRSAPTNTGMWFVVGVTAASGPTVPTLITSLTQYEAVYGLRSAAGAAPLYDAIDAFFHEGGSQVTVMKAATNGGPDIIAALAKFDEKLGPGQVSAPGISTSAVHTAISITCSRRAGALLEHRAKRDRVAAAATSLRTRQAARRAGSPATKTVPASRAPRAPSARQPEAGVVARNDVRTARTYRRRARSARRCTRSG
jgi:hypothetical protein